MKPDLGALSVGPVWLVGAGVTLVGLLALARVALDLTPMSPAWRSRVGRARPVAALGLVLLYALYATRAVFGVERRALPFAVALVVAGVAAASWSTLRDLLGGVSLKAGRVFQVGDHVRIGDVEGRVERLGYRAVIVRTARGDEAVIPFGRVLGDTVVRTHTPGGVVPHEFEVELPPRLGYRAASTLIRRAALYCHWSSVARDPDLSPAGGVIKVTVFALDREHAPEIESAVRAALDSRAREASRASSASAAS
jgi:ribosomal protein L35AE/L33A